MSTLEHNFHGQQSYYDFRYDDEDTVLNEIEEFYSFVETPQIDENWKAWQSGSFTGGGWSTPCTRGHILTMIFWVRCWVKYLDSMSGVGVVSHWVRGIQNGSRPLRARRRHMS